MRILNSQNLFLPALVLAVFFHLLCFLGVLWKVPEQNFPRDKGMIFLGSILDSAQMERTSFLSQGSNKDSAVFSSYVPPRSEREYFDRLKDVNKPAVRMSDRKKEAKTTFSAPPSVKANEYLWSPKDAPGYQPLKISERP